MKKLIQRLCLTLSLLALFVVSSVAPASAGVLGFNEWGLTAFGNDSMDVASDDVYGSGLIAHVARPLMKNRDLRLDFRLEGELGVFWDYDTAAEVALVPGLRLYLCDCPVSPYFEAGVGLSYNTLDIQEMGIGFNFLSYGGGGIRFPLQDNMSLEFGYRMRHISNAGLDEINGGVTSNQLQVGVSWAF